MSTALIRNNMEIWTPKYSITRKITIAIFSVVTLFLIQFAALYFSSQTPLSGLATLHRQQQLSDSVLRLHQLTDTLAEIPSQRGTASGELKKLFESVSEQAEAKIPEAKALSQTPGEMNYLNQITDGLSKLKLSGNRYFELAPSLNSDRELLLIQQFSSDVAEGEEKLKLLLEQKNNETFAGVYRLRYQPFEVTIALTFLFILLALMAGMSFKRQTSTSILNLLHATQEVAHGNLNLMAPVLVRDEIGALTEAFNSMTRTLKQSTVSRNYVEAVIQSLPDSLFVLSPDGKIEQTNRTGGNISGESPDSLKGEFLRNLLESKTPDLMAELRDVETTFISRTGRSIPVSVSTSVIRSQSARISGVVCILKDLSERKEIEAEKKRIAESQLALADASSILSESIDFDLTLKNVVRAIVPRIADCCFVHLVDSAGSLKVSELNCREQKGEPTFEANSALKKAIQSGKSVFVDTRLEPAAVIAGHPDILLYLVCPFSHRNQIAGTISVGFFNPDRRFDNRDIILIEEFARRAAIALDNSRLYHEVQEAVLSRDEFLSIASHELKTPLTSLSLQLQILNREILRSQKENPNQQRVSLPVRTLKIISSSETQSGKLAALLDELLDLTRIRLGKLQLVKEEIDLSAIVKGVVDRFRAEASQKQITLHLDVEKSIVGCWDSIRVEQVVSNLISNAVKYGNGSAITVRASQEGPIARLVVADQGMGIPSDMLDKIFERFERAGVSGRKISGLGLGLYICRQIIEAHGGSIHVESKLGNGSTFTVDFPLALAVGTKLVS